MNILKSRFFAFAIIALFLGSSCGQGEKKAKYVFYFIGDGMGFSHVALAEAYKASKAGKIGSEPLLFTQFPAMGMATTYSASNYITCSSAAGTALSTGSKTKNHMLGVDPDTVDLTSISYKIHDAGYKVGIMTTVTIDHATPGAFYAHSPKRSNYYDISTELPLSGFEFFGGGGFEGLKDAREKEKSLYTLARENGYTVAFGMSDFNFKKDTSERIIYFQEKEKAGSILPYAFDRKGDDLTLAQVVESAIGFLDNPNGFFIMAEGGKIDWAAHSNDVINTIFETLDMDEAIEVAYQFYLKHPDETLIVVTADHETGGVSLGRTKGYNFDLTLVPDKIADTSATVHDISVENYMETVPIDSLSKQALIGWTTSSHTGGAVPVFAIGAGSAQFTGRMDNTDIPKKIINAMGLSW